MNIFVKLLQFNTLTTTVDFGYNDIEETVVIAENELNQSTLNI